MSENEAEKLDPVEYELCQRQIIMISEMINELPLAQFLKQLNFANDFGCFFEPTLWNKAHGKLAQLKEISESLLHHQSVFRKLKEQAKV